MLAFDAAGLSVDVELFRSMRSAARRARDVDEYRRALALYQGELLPDDRYDAWAGGPRRELHIEFLAGLSTFAPARATSRN